MDRGRILYVRGIGKTISKEELTIYFQSHKQSGGGDISSIDLDGDEAVITFEDDTGKFCLHVLVCQLFRCLGHENRPFLYFLAILTSDVFSTFYILSVLAQGQASGFTFNICVLAFEDKQLSYTLTKPIFRHVVSATFRKSKLKSF